MKDVKFMLECKPLLKKYKGLFSTIPNSSEYALTREDYVKALKKAIKDEVPLDNFIPKRDKTNDPNALN